MDLSLANLVRLQPPLVGTEMLYIVDSNGVDRFILVSDLVGQGIQEGKNNDSQNWPAFALLANSGTGFILAQNNVDQNHATVCAIALSATVVGHLGLVQFAGFLSGLAGLTPGALWLGTNGAILATAPIAPGTYQTKVGTAFSATTMFLNVQAPMGPNA